MATTSAPVTQMVDAKACDLCHSIYAKGTTGLPAKNPPGSGLFSVHGPVSYGASQAMDLCPACTGVIWDLLQERIQPNPNAPPRSPPRPPPPPPVPRGPCLVEYVAASANTLARICSMERGHSGLHDDSAATASPLFRHGMVR